MSVYSSWTNNILYEVYLWAVPGLNISYEACLYTVSGVTVYYMKQVCGQFPGLGILFPGIEFGLWEGENFGTS